MRSCFAAICCLLLVGCGSRTGLNTAAAGTQVDASPPSGCADSPDSPTMLAAIGDYGSDDQVTAMTVARGYVYYEVGPNAKDYGLFRVPVTGGTPSPILQDVSACDTSSPFAVGNLASDGHYVFGRDEEAIGCTGYPVHISAYDTANGALFQLPIPSAADSQPRALSPQALAGGGAAWVIDPGSYTGPAVLARWTGGSASTVVALLPGWATTFVVSAGVAYVTTIAKGKLTLYSASLANGAIDQLGTYGTDFALVGANDEAIFYTPDGSTLSRRDAADGQVSVLPVKLPAHATWVDHDWFYFDEKTPPDFPAVVMRIPARGGAAREIYRSDTRDGIEAISGDACNVYFVAGPDYKAQRAPALFVRRR